MANEAIYELTQEPSLNAADRFVLQQTAASTRATSATFALMGGLEYDTTYDTNADHVDFTATAGMLYGIDMSGAALLSEVIVDLPAEANVEVGERVGFYITAGSSTDGEELAIRTAAVGDTINGTDYNASDWSRLFITGELVIFQCINKTTQADWIVLHDGRIPCNFEMQVSTAGTSNTAGAITIWTDSTSLVLTANWNVGSTATIADTRCTARRDATWWFHAFGATNGNVTAGNYFGMVVRKNGTTTIGQQRVENGGSIQTGIGATALHQLTDGDYVEACFRPQQANMGLGGTNNGTSAYFGYEVLRA